jgi:putative transposase
MFGCQQVLIYPNTELKAVLEFICTEANKLHNCAVYYARQLYFKTGKYTTGFDLSTTLKLNPHYQALCAQAAQQVCGSVGESIRSYKTLKKLFKKGQLPDKPKLPKYRTKDGLQLVAYPRQALRKKLVDGKILVPLGEE